MMDELEKDLDLFFELKEIEDFLTKRIERRDFNINKILKLKGNENKFNEK